MVNHLVQAAVSDPAFIAEAERQKLDIDAVPGDGVAQLLSNAYTRSPDMVSAAREALSLTQLQRKLIFFVGLALVGQLFA
jgi:hypothetical protein